MLPCLSLSKPHIDDWDDACSLIIGAGVKLIDITEQQAQDRSSLGVGVDRVKTYVHVVIITTVVGLLLVL